MSRVARNSDGPSPASIRAEHPPGHREHTGRRRRQQDGGAPAVSGERPGEHDDRRAVHQPAVRGDVRRIGRVAPGRRHQRPQPQAQARARAARSAGARGAATASATTSPSAPSAIGAQAVSLYSPPSSWLAPRAVPSIARPTAAIRSPQIVDRAGCAGVGRPRRRGRHGIHDRPRGHPLARPSATSSSRSARATGAGLAPVTLENGGTNDRAVERPQRLLWAVLRRNGVRKEREHALSRGQSLRLPLHAGPVASDDDHRHPRALVARDPADQIGSALSQRAPVARPDRQRSRIRVDAAAIVEHRVLVGVVRGAGFHERLHERGLAGERRARNHERAAIQGDNPGVNEQPIPGVRGDRQPHLRVEQRQRHLERRMLDRRGPADRHLVGIRTGLTQREPSRRRIRLGGRPTRGEDLADPGLELAESSNVSCESARRTTRSSPSTLGVYAAAPRRCYAVGGCSPESINAPERAGGTAL